jgi:hypothetical protein
MISLEKAIRTCKVNTQEANRIESDRYLNPHNMVCPMWQGVDLTGRTVCKDSFYTKSPGCNSAEDRVVVENNVSRPQYYEYITLNSQGLQQGGMGGGMGGGSGGGSGGNSNMIQQEAQNRSSMVRDIHQDYPSFSTGNGNIKNNTCGVGQYQKAMNQMNN